MVLRTSFYIHWSVGRSPRVHEVNPGRGPSIHIIVKKMKSPLKEEKYETSVLHRCSENIGLGFHGQEEGF